MIVSFPACGAKAKYNYARTLKRTNCYRLFIKDDFGEDQRGNYLVEENTEKLVIRLIESIYAEKKIRKMIFVGSSKGGYEAINFSFHFPQVTVVAGGPQYYLNCYLKKCNAMSALRDILGNDYTQEHFEILNNKIERENKVISQYTQNHLSSLFK